MGYNLIPCTYIQHLTMGYNLAIVVVLVVFCCIVVVVVSLLLLSEKCSLLTLLIFRFVLFVFMPF